MALVLWGFHQAKNFCTNILTDRPTDRSIYRSFRVAPAGEPVDDDNKHDDVGGNDTKSVIINSHGVFLNERENPIDG